MSSRLLTNQYAAESDRGMGEDLDESNCVQNMYRGIDQSMCDVFRMDDRQTSLPKVGVGWHLQEIAGLAEAPPTMIYTIS